MPISSRIVTLGIFVLSSLTCSVAVHAQHAQHQSMKSARIELGTSAAIDSQGQLWIASKETAGTAQYVVLQRSRDMGKTWSPPRRIQQAPEPVSADGENRPKLAFGSKGEIYVSYTKPLAKPYTGEIRFVRSVDGGESFSPPITIHANRDEITHRFDSLIVDKAGRIYVAWIDKRDVEAAQTRKEQYAGAAIYYAVSDDAGSSFRGDYKIADHSCECCRIALALNPEGNPVAMWRHVFDPNARDHALAELTPDGKLSGITRASFEDWRVDACPHHGPALSYATDGTRHQVWFNVKDNEGGVFYASAPASGVLSKPVRLGSDRAEHADVAVHGKEIVLVWKQFDGKSTAIFAKLSNDGGLNWDSREIARTEGSSDHPHLAGNVVIWRTQNEGMRVLSLKTGT